MSFVGLSRPKRPIISFPEKFKPAPKVGLYLFEQGYAIMIFGLWIRLGLKAREPEDMLESWALSFVREENALVGTWGSKNKVFYMPWDLIRVKCEILTQDANFVPMIMEPHPHFSKMMNSDQYKDHRAMHYAPFNYITTKGIVQNTKAIFYVTRSEYRWRIFTKKNFGPKRVSYEINVTFKNQIGEGVGSWRGGRSGGTFEIIPEDQGNPFKALHRVNMTKRF